MIEKLLRRFCEARHRSLIVIGGTFVVGLVLILPLVDVYSAGRSEQEELLGELESAREVVTDLGGLETRVKEKVAELEAFEQRTVDDQSLPALREKLMNIAKDTQCSIRRLNVGSVASRPWSPGDNPIGPSEARNAEAKPNYVLEWRPVSISLSGSEANLRSLMERITTGGMLVHAKSLEMYPVGPKRESRTLDLELWYFTLAQASDSA